MNVTKSAIYRMEIARECGCKASGEYDDEAYKKARGVASFTPCETHKELPGIDMVGEVLKEAVTKEALAVQLPPRVHPRTAERLGIPEDADPNDAVSQMVGDGEGIADTPQEDQAPVRTLRSSGTSGKAARTGGHRPASAPPPGPSRPGSHRPQGGGGGGKGMFGRVASQDGGKPSIMKELAKTASTSSGKFVDGGIEVGGSMDEGEAAEDIRLTRLLAETQARAEAQGADDDDDDGDFFS